VSRFSKSVLLDYINRHCDALEQEWKFDSDNGYAQVEGKSSAANRAYGEWNALRTIVEVFDLDGAR
jgi:hypothetical protein